MTQTPHISDISDDVPEIVATSASYPRVRHVWGITALMILIFLVIGAVGLTLFGSIAMVFSEVAIVVPAVIFLRVTGFSPKEVFRLNPIGWRLGILSIVIGLSLSVVASAFDTVLNSLFPMPEEMRRALVQLLVIDSPEELFVTSCGLVFAAATCEELFFRGFLQATIEWRQGPLRAIILSSLAFSFVHFNPWWFPSILFAGVMFGILAYASGSVYPGIIAHAVNNGLSLLIVNASQFESMRWLGALDMVSFPVVAVSVLILTASLTWMLIRKRSYTNHNRQLITGN